jgi:hypothetical protein
MRGALINSPRELASPALSQPLALLVLELLRSFGLSVGGDAVCRAGHVSYVRHPVVVCWLMAPSAVARSTRSVPRSAPAYPQVAFSTCYEAPGLLPEKSQRLL